MKKKIIIYLFLFSSLNSYADDASNFLKKRNNSSTQETEIRLENSEEFSRKKQIESTIESIETVEGIKKWFREVMTVTNITDTSQCNSITDQNDFHECLADAYIKADVPSINMARNNCQNITNKNSGIYLNCMSLVELASRNMIMAESNCSKININSEEDRDYYHQCYSSINLAKGKLYEAENSCKMMTNNYNGMYATCIENINLIKEQMQQQRDAAAKAQYEAEQEAEKNRRVSGHSSTSTTSPNKSERNGLSANTCFQRLGVRSCT